ncbi:MAG: hypothetical protein RBS24_04790 [Bacilli bacterium]|nr:hypothetical protein [Bacilli bacterium]
MSIYKFETSFPFPIIKLTTLIHHTEVSKPTGISYIILVLINESTNKKVKLSNLLIQFGVPSDLHGIFADEIYNLIHELEIIECKSYEYNRAHFSEYFVGDFAFTIKGKKVFIDELIPSSKTIESKQELFYHPAYNQLMDKIPSDWKMGKIDSSILPNKLAEQFAFNNLNELEECLNSVKGKGIVVKKDEIITSVSIMNNEYFYTTFPIILSIDNEKHSIDFDFGDDRLQSFFEKYYDNQLISEGLGIKKKFKFKGHQPSLIDAKIIDNAIVKLPEDYEEVLNKTAAMIITKSNYMPKQTAHVIKMNDLLSNLSSHIETIHIDSEEKISAFIPIQTPLTNKANKGKIPINLLIELSLKEHEKKTMSNALMNHFKTYSIENAKESLYIFKVLNEKQSLEKIMNSYLSNDIERDINILKEIKDTNDISYIRDWFDNTAQSLFDEYFGSLPINTIENQLALGGWLIKHLSVQNIMMIHKIIKSNPNENQEKLFLLLEHLNYSLNDIFAQVDVLKEFTQKIINTDKIDSTGNFSNLVKTIQFGLSQLIELTNIRKPHQFIIKEDMDSSKFLEVYNAFSVKLEELLKYEKFDTRAFQELKEFNKHFKYLSQVITEEKKASGNPKGIDQSFVTSKINKKEYFTAIVYLFTKLEWVLKNQYKLNGNMESMINELKDIDEIKMLVPELHQLRKLRNSLIHPTGVEVTINSDDLVKWNDIVFKEVLKI